MTDFPLSTLSFRHLYKVKPVTIKKHTITSARFWKTNGFSICIEKEKKSHNSGTGSYDFHNEHGKETYKEARLRWQKNHIGFTPRHQAHPWKILMCRNITVCTFPRARISAIFGFPTCTWNMGFFSQILSGFRLCLAPACSPGAQRKTFYIWV